MSEIELANRILGGDRLILARTLSQVENGTAEGMATLNALYPHTGQAHLVGMTGASGTGKSSLVNQLAHHYRHPTHSQDALRVAVVAVDPTSPFTGGAVLGDRIRMRDLAGDQGVFIRSMATRGSLGGIASATGAVAQVLDAAGFELILIETVGAGQSEVDIARLAHTTIVVEAPGFGDDIQAIKAGILEIADVLVVNKADLPGAENTERALRGSLSLGRFNRPGEHSLRRVVHHGQLTTVDEPEHEPQPAYMVWTPPILRTNALDGSGVKELADAIAAHREYLENTGSWGQRERVRIQTELDLLLQDRLLGDFRSRLEPGKYESVLTEVLERRISPFQAVKELIDRHQ